MSRSSEVSFGAEELIISKTDLKGNITYANRIFMRVSNFAESELLGKPHNIIRHPDMPKGVFYGLWKTLKAGDEFFGFVKNYTADKNYYWVFANVTPDKVDNKPIGYFSVRRNAPRMALDYVQTLYSKMLEIERSAAKSEAAKKSWMWLEEELLKSKGLSYDKAMLCLYLSHLDEGV
ncbi:PAS domain-containing protein [Gallaecimonas sp. GXIMD1310]|uniref:PAS domain-containing protein n=1 Tax=Gallaecimonas sp. GXIMD1310 TaxID=3131926 RepID=UPI00324E12CD